MSIQMIEAIRVHQYGGPEQLKDEGHIKAIIAQTFPLRQASLAHELSQTSHGRGRIILHIAK